tara:strand:- start:299 stop:721 length:423 start_codon:yes stop_codon:yes gene_type:complete
MKLHELLIELHVNCLLPIRKVSNNNNITPSQLLCILSIPFSGISQVELAHILSLDVSTLSRNLDKLINKQLINKKTALMDKRSYIIYLTDIGKKLYNQSISELECHFSSIYENLHIKDIESLLAGIQSINWELSKKTINE